jgi:ABC-type transport system substrate-binding protein
MIDSKNNDNHEFFTMLFQKQSRRIIACALLSLAPMLVHAQTKVLRYAFPVAETGFDPAQISDLYSSTIAANIFESLLAYDYLARPAQLRPQTAATMPQVSPDFKVFTVRVRPGIYFGDDSAFKGQRRELTAQDYVYSIKRLSDPRWKSPSYQALSQEGIVGLDKLRTQALQAHAPFDYDTEVPGLRALDRYTLRIELSKPSPRFLFNLADSSSMGAVAREVVQAYGDHVAEHPVGTGPFRLTQWERSSRMVLERNPNYHEEFFAANPAPDDVVGQAIAKQLAGKRLPLIDRVEVSVIEQSQPRWLAFLNGEHDLIERLPDEFFTLAVTQNELAPHLAKRGIQLQRSSQSDIYFTYFNMQHPLVGGYSPEKVALRRAIGLGFDTRAEIAQMRKGQASLAQSTLPPGTFGYDARWRSEMSQYDAAKAKALLDLYNYTDKNGDGWRDLPDGQPLKLVMSTTPDQQARQRDELWKKFMTALNIQIDFKTAQWPEHLKAARTGAHMMWSLGNTASSPDADGFLSMGYGPQKGENNLAFFDLPAFNQLYEAQNALGDTPQRLKLMQQASELLVAYMPMKVHGHKQVNDLVFPWVSGYKRHPFRRDYWRYIDIVPNQSLP